MEAFVTRQPIFSRDLQVYGYRLLFPQDLVQTPHAVAGHKRAPYIFHSRFAAAEFEALGGGKPLLVKLTGEQVVDDQSSSPSNL